MMRRTAVLAVVLALAVPTGAGAHRAKSTRTSSGTVHHVAAGTSGRSQTLDWMSIVRADGNLDLGAARRAALDIIKAHPRSAEAVAAAGWWFDNIQVIPDPDEILSAATGNRDPELGFLLDRIEGSLLRRPPRGVLTPVELSGPFGSFDTLDILRNVVPADAALPPLGSTWNGPAHPFRLVMRTPDGVARPPEPFAAPGVYLAAWSFDSPRPADGWMVVEATGTYRLELDGKPGGFAKDCGNLGAAVRWYRLHIGAGRHRLRVAMASTDMPEVRVSLLDGEGRELPVHVLHQPATPPWASSHAAASLPPAEGAFDRTPGPAKGLEGTLLAAQLAHIRHDPLAERAWLDGAPATASGAPELHLARAQYFLTEPTGAAPQVDFRRCREQLAACSKLPKSLLLAHELDLRQRRTQDAETVLDTLVDHDANDPRVLRLWVRAAVRRGWVREASQALRKLHAMLPGSAWVARLRLNVDRSLERWTDRNRVIEGLAASDWLAPDTVDLLISAGREDLALDVLRRQKKLMDNPKLDLGIARLLHRLGRTQEAAAQLRKVYAAWGRWDGTDQLGVVLAADGPSAALARAVRATLGRHPADLELRSLAWREGMTPFFEPFRIDALAFAAAHSAPTDGVDSELILDQGIERVFKDGSSLYYYHGLTKALTPAGVKDASTISLLPGSVLLRVRIIKADGTIIVPPGISASQSQVVLKNVSPGDMVEDEYVAPIGATGSSHRGHVSPYVYRFAGPNRSFVRSEYTLLVPPDLTLNIDGNFTGLKHTDTTFHGLRLLSWQATSVPPVVSEPFSPPSQELFPWVAYGFGVSWQDIGDSIRNRVLGALRGSPELWRWAEPLVSAKDPREALTHLVDALVDKVDAGDADLNVRQTAGESFSRGKGNRLTILIAILKHAGWNVDLVMTRPLAFSHTSLKVPGFSAFVIPVLRVSHGGKTFWIDMNEGRKGIGHIRAILQGSDGYVLPLTSPSQPVRYLDPLPRFPNPGLEEDVSLRAKVDASGAADLTYEILLRGAQGERLFKLVSTVPVDRVPAIYEQIAARIFPGADKVTGDIVRQDGGVALDLRLHLPQACTPSGDAMECRALTTARPLSPRLASLPSRKFPLVLQLPIEQRIELNLIPPPGWAVDMKSRTYTAPWGHVDRAVTTKGRSVRTVTTLQIPARVITTAQYPDFVRFCHAVDEIMVSPLRLIAQGH
ncbi:MAG: hypothetical protein GXP48_03720 [Acidobacteria bacterium]|nr:hypothetical protein [Acidobacteriota bacterium]